jgi:hypothetical protein
MYLTPPSSLTISPSLAKARLASAGLKYPIVNQFPPFSSLSGGAISALVIDANDCESELNAVGGYPNIVRNCGFGFSFGFEFEFGVLALGVRVLAGAEEERAGVLKTVEEFLKSGPVVVDEVGVQAGASCREVEGGASSSFISIRL